MAYPLIPTIGLAVSMFVYVLLCAFVPWRYCGRCDGTGSVGKRPCRRCNETGKRLRYGRRVFNHFARLHRDAR